MFPFFINWLSAGEFSICSAGKKAVGSELKYF
jgi:hypothetical protein